jgi:methyl coenzyme M reductase subunit D
VSAAVGGTVTDCGCEFYKHRYCVSSSVLLGIEYLEDQVPSRLLLFVDETSQLKMEVFYIYRFNVICGIL